tara:strand:+ start:5788 stop:6675 length:888 start_codon:yes stop_codon:yes gene_type:complete
MSEEEQIISEVGSEAGVTPEVEAAPVEAEYAPSVADAEVEPAPADDSPLVDSGEGTPASFPSADEFSWDDWDGLHESLPDQVQTWSQRFNTYYTTRQDTALEEQRRSDEDTKRIYEALIGGNEDPRVGEYQQQVSEWEQKHTAQIAEQQKLQTQYDEYQKSINDAIDQEATQYAVWFKSEYKDLFADKKLESTFYELVDEGWELEPAAKATRLPQQALVLARKAKADGVPDTYALRFASGGARRTQAPRPGARITAGATTPSRAPEQTQIVDNSALSMKDLRGQVARNALKKHRS